MPGIRAPASLAAGSLSPFASLFTVSDNQKTSPRSAGETEATLALAAEGSISIVAINSNETDAGTSPPARSGP